MVKLRQVKKDLTDTKYYVWNCLKTVAKKKEFLELNTEEAKKIDGNNLSSRANLAELVIPKDDTTIKTLIEGADYVDRTYSYTDNQEIIDLAYLQALRQKSPELHKLHFSKKPRAELLEEAFIKAVPQLSSDSLKALQELELKFSDKAYGKGFVLSVIDDTFVKRDLEYEIKTFVECGFPKEEIEGWHKIISLMAYPSDYGGLKKAKKNI